MAVVLQALNDIAIGDADDKRIAVAWLSSRDMVIVCDAADMNPEGVRKIGLLLLDTPDRERRRNIISRIRERISR